MTPALPGANCIATDHREEFHTLLSSYSEFSLYLFRSAFYTVPYRILSHIGRSVPFRILSLHPSRPAFYPHISIPSRILFIPLSVPHFILISVPFRQSVPFCRSVPYSHPQFNSTQIFMTKQVAITPKIDILNLL